ncbi:glycosyltransferase family 4 protein [Vibrio breoganii]|uniref:glycosyltransferase family 4 protein n=1 Tax=Vibrio breoganii TaxID=553239 RepID=UPI000C81B570|nr:glycosyltransferase family 4 protein [Vibrio breoganii]PML94604.1 hypothetical protein BCT64_11005 [Vibrio breoganii]PMN72794.1 hypothetical protein BCT28_16840 [Vibrio breoganii]
MNSSSTLKYLIIGSSTNGIKENVGGTTILVDQMLDFFTNNNIEHRRIITNTYRSNLINMLCFFVGMLRNIIFVDVVILNAARKSMFILGPITYIFCCLFSKKLVFRKFGGRFESMINESKVKKYLSESTFLKSDLICIENKSTLDYFNCNYKYNLFWFPNTRKNTDLKVLDKFNKKFVFVSAVKETKGILLLIECFKAIGGNYTLDIYGPVVDENIKTSLENSSENVNYMGILSPHEVVGVLTEYDILVLPSFHDGEGYPGVVIEAFSVGMPCIVTRWNSLPEIIKHQYNGLLVEPKELASLTEAILSIDEELYKKLNVNTVDSFRDYDVDLVLPRFINRCEDLYK